MEVPDWVLKGIRRLSYGKPVGAVPSEYAAIILTPGAVISGWKFMHVIINW